MCRWVDGVHIAAERRILLAFDILLAVFTVALNLVALTGCVALRTILRYVITPLAFVVDIASRAFLLPFTIASDVAYLATRVASRAARNAIAPLRPYPPHHHHLPPKQGPSCALPSGLSTVPSPLSLGWPGGEPPAWALRARQASRPPGLLPLGLEPLRARGALYAHKALVNHRGRHRQRVQLARAPSPQGHLQPPPLRQQDINR